MSRRPAQPCTSPGCIENADPLRGTHNRCEGCHKAARDTESPLNLTAGTWTRAPGGIRTWVPAPTSLPVPARPRATRKAAA